MILGPDERRTPSVAGRSRFDWRWLLASLFCLGAVLTATHLPQDPTPEFLRDGPLQIDKIEHILVYGAIGACVMLAVSRGLPRKLAATLVVLTIVALLDELTQPLVGRTASVWDFLADVFGLMLAAGTIAMRHMQCPIVPASCQNVGGG